MIKQWWTKQASPTQFWLPMSGLIGGCMMGAIVGLISYWVCLISYWIFH